MADLTSTSTISVKRNKKAMQLSDTIAGLGTRTYTITLPNPANAADLFVLGKLPVGTLPVGVFTKANATIASNTGIEWQISANANGAGGVAVIANVATGIHAAGWGYAAPVTTSNTAPVSANEMYLVGVVRGNSTAAVHTVTATFVLAGVDVESAPYSTFTF